MKTFAIAIASLLLLCGCSRVEKAEVKMDSYQDGALIFSATKTYVVLSTSTENVKIGDDLMLHANVPYGKSLNYQAYKNGVGGQKAEFAITANGPICLTYPMLITFSENRLKGVKMVYKVISRGDGFKIGTWIF